MSINGPFTVKMPAPSVIGTGLIALDVLITKGEKPAAQRTGGTCGNVLSILSYLGWNSYPVARLNGDDASQRVLADLHRWGVRLEFAETQPGAETPIVIHKIRKNLAGQAVHRFSLNCPYCGAFLPRYRAIVGAAAAEVGTQIKTQIKSPKVFFFDRVSRGALLLAQACADEGALIVFEPSGAGDAKQFAKALALTHILKYSQERVHNFKDLLSRARPLLEVETLGQDGLRYRRGIDKGKSWQKRNGLQLASVKDSAGAGDWCTAGLIHHLGQEGLRGFTNASADSISEALHFGQALAAWTCGFEGARGGMYTRDNLAFKREVTALLESAFPQAQMIQSNSAGDKKQTSPTHRITMGKSRSMPGRARVSRAACCF